MMRQTEQMRFLVGFFLVAPLAAQTLIPPAIMQGREELAHGQFREARSSFAAYAKVDPHSAPAAMGEGDADLALHFYEDAEFAYRRAVAIEPELWVAHKHLVEVEAKLGRWEEFDRERAILRGARERGAPNITAQESDLIDGFIVNGRAWSVREYLQPMGRSEARYNFESLGGGHAAEYISLEPQQAAEAALQRDAQVTIGAAPKSFGDVKVWGLNWYSAKGHGTVKTYANGEPKYEALRADVLHWLHGAAAHTQSAK